MNKPRTDSPNNRIAIETTEALKSLGYAAAVLNTKDMDSAEERYKAIAKRCKDFIDVAAPGPPETELSWDQFRKMIVGQLEIILTEVRGG